MTPTTITEAAEVPAAKTRGPAASASALTGAWFEASTGAGSVRLYANGTARHAIDAAVTLVRYEALLDALDAWIGAALQWCWIAAPTSVTSTASHARAHWQPDDGDRGRREPACRLELPWALLRALPAPDEALARRLRWPEVPVVLAIAQLQVGADELALLEPGGAVVLPESMHRDWQGTLRALDEPSHPDAGVPVRLALPAPPRRIPAGARVAASRADGGDRARCEVRLSTPNTVAGDRLAGWFDGELGDASSRASLWLCGTERAPASCLATGELMPWGDGWALAVQQL
jgi:hypothetical protein